MRAGSSVKGRSHLYLHLRRPWSAKHSGKTENMTANNNTQKQITKHNSVSETQTGIGRYVLDNDSSLQLDASANASQIESVQPATRKHCRRGTDPFQFQSHPCCCVFWIAVVFCKLLSCFVNCSCVVFFYCSVLDYRTFRTKPFPELPSTPAYTTIRKKTSIPDSWKCVTLKRFPVKKIKS